MLKESDAQRLPKDLKLTTGRATDSGLQSQPRRGPSDTPGTPTPVLLAITQCEEVCPSRSMVYSVLPCHGLSRPDRLERGPLIVRYETHCTGRTRPHRRREPGAHWRRRRSPCAGSRLDQTRAAASRPEPDHYRCAGLFGIVDPAGRILGVFLVRSLDSDSGNPRYPILSEE